VDLVGIGTKSMQRRCDNQGPVLSRITLLPTQGTSTGTTDHLHGFIHGYVLNTICLKNTIERTLAAYDTFREAAYWTAFCIISSAIERYFGNTALHPFRFLFISST